MALHCLTGCPALQGLGLARQGLAEREKTRQTLEDMLGIF